MPTTVPTLDAELSDSATSLTLTTTADVGENGFVQIDNEWMHYRGIAQRQHPDAPEHAPRAALQCGRHARHGNTRSTGASR